jgi:hypothetical protein
MFTPDFYLATELGMLSRLLPADLAKPQNGTNTALFMDAADSVYGCDSRYALRLSPTGRRIAIIVGLIIV